MRGYCIDCKKEVVVGEGEHALANCPSCGGFLDAAPEEPVLRKRPRPYVSRIALVDADKLDQLEQHTRNLEFEAEARLRHEQEAPHSACTCRLCTALRCHKELERLCTHLEAEKKQAVSDAVECFATMGCEQHTGENTPPFEDFNKLLKGRCHICDVQRIAVLESTIANLESDLASEAAQRSALEHMLAQVKQTGGIT